MEPLDFLAAVLPTEGIYCVAELSTKKKEHAYGETLAELAPHIARFNEAKLNTYFALASFKEAGNRLAENAQTLRSFFLDIDTGKKNSYATKKEAVLALQDFLHTTGMPAPWLVDSGGGVHVYWPFTESMGVAEWYPVAENLKRLCKQHELKADLSITADCARVLRVPGTTNWKIPDSPRPVKVKVVGAPQHNSFADLKRAIERTLNEPAQVQPGFNVPGERLAQPATPSLVNVLENRITYFKSIVDRTVAGTGCAQLKYYFDHAQDDGMEPLWRACLSIAKVCADGDKAAKKLTKAHPYTESRMHTKLREIKGPYPCGKFDSENPGICPKCAFWGKITNPLALGHEIQTDNTEKEIAVLPADPSIPPHTVIRPTPPHGFSYGAKGGIYRVKEEEDGEGNKVPVNKLILPYDLFVVDLLDAGEDGHLVQMLAMRPEGPTTVTIPQRSVVSREETVKALAQQNILAAYGAGNDRNLFDYVRGAVEGVSSARRAVHIPEAFGWEDDSHFILNGKIFSPRDEHAIPMPRLANIVRLTTPAGSLSEWRRVPEMLIQRKHYDILALALVAFGAPLMYFAPFKALTFHIGSTESGAGKSLALNLAASVWGSDNYIISASSSLMAQEHRLGVLRNLPLIIDEITEANNKDFEWLSSFVMYISGGIGKERMKSSTNEERDNYTTWRSLTLLASNTHTTDFFSAVRKKIAEGHLRRILELKMEKTITWSLEEQDTVGLLRENYGVAGREYVRWLVRNADSAREIYKKMYTMLRTNVNATGDERFWVAGCAACIAGAVLVGPKYANIVDIPVGKVVRVFEDLIEEARLIVQSNKRGAEDVLNSYTREFFGNMVVVKINKATKRMETSFGDGGVIDKTITRSSVKGRVEHGAFADKISYFIEEQQMKAWCSNMNYGYRDFCKQLEKVFTVRFCKKDLLAKTNGPQMRVSAIQIIRPISPLDEDEPAIPVEHD